MLTLQETNHLIELGFRGSLNIGKLFIKKNTFIYDYPDFIGVSLIDRITGERIAANDFNSLIGALNWIEEFERLNSIV